MRKLIYPICIVVILWFALSTTEVWIHSLDTDYVYNRANIWAIMSTYTTEMKVINCEIDKPTDTWLVTVEDIKGNQYSYYDSEIQYNGWIKEITMQGKNIVDVR